MHNISQSIARGLSDLKSFRVVHYESIGSTNDEAFRLANETSEELLLLIADTQTSGRGRHGKQWYSPEGNLYMSLLLKGGIILGLKMKDHLHLITLAAGVAVAETVHSLYGYRPLLKWPNDIMGADRKIGGILTESRFKGTDPALLVIGIGLNLVHFNPEGELLGKAASLSEFIREPLSREHLLTSITRSLLKWIKTICTIEAEGVISRWCSWSSTLGRRVEVINDGFRVVGIAKSIDHLGRLVVTPEGSNDTVVIASGSLLYVDR